MTFPFYVYNIAHLAAGFKSQTHVVSDFVFTNTLGKPYAANAINFALDNIVKAYNKLEDVQAEKEGREPDLLPHISAHILRHTACTSQSAPAAKAAL